MNESGARAGTSKPAPEQGGSPRLADRRRVAVVGYGEAEGREHARRLRDFGHDVAVAMLPGGISWVNAVNDGFRPLRVWEAVLGADVIVMLVPDDDVALVYWEQVAPYVRPGAILLFTGPISPEIDELPAGVDVASIVMNEDGCLACVQQDATSLARSRALDYLQWLGAEVPRARSSRVRVRESSDPFPHPMRRVL
jgi:ketol-acid reductoisomerase